VRCREHRARRVELARREVDEVGRRHAEVDNVDPLPADTLAELGAAVLLIVAFLVLERRRREPMLDLSLFRNKAFGPYLAGVRERLDYRQARCLTSDLVCTQSIWLEHAMLLGTRDDMDDIAAAFEKIHGHRDQLEGR